MAEQKRFKNKKFENGNHKVTENAAKAVKGTLALGTVLAPVGVALKKHGVKGVKEGVKLAAKTIFKV